MRPEYSILNTLNVNKMAVKKRKKATGATKKRKTRTAPKKRISIAGSGTFTHDSCGTKTDMKKRADRIRAQGNKVRLIETGGRTCLYKGGKMKANSVFMKMRRKRRAA